MPRPGLSIDTTRLWFAAKFVLVILIVFAGVRYGTALAEEKVLEPIEATLAETEARLEELLDRRPKTPEDATIRALLQSFEARLSSRTIQSPSAEALSQAHRRLIAADLGTMQLYLYEDGHATVTIPILSKGKRGSRWETPTGLYKIETKAEDHFSSIGAVHMPYAMQFFGNFFVHGWPYYPDGTPVPEGFSGGCIRLSTEDAARVYAFARSGTPIFIWESATEHAPFEIDESVRLPRLSAASFLIADVRSGTVYAERFPEKPFPIASVTKLVTALVANETTHYDRLLSVTSDDRRATDGTPGNIILNDLITVGDALYALLLESNNAVAYTLARYHGSDNFMRWMNDKARAIGMMQTSFEDPSGISANNISTANDLFRLMRYIHESQSYILGMSRETQKTIVSDSGSRYPLGNFNHFAGDPRFVGGKVGYTEAARETMTAIFDVPVGDRTATIAIVILGSSDRKKDVRALVDWFTRAVRSSE